VPWARVGEGDAAASSQPLVISKMVKKVFLMRDIGG
jgi:hypothetical protein